MSFVSALTATAASGAPVWRADRGDGTYRNPILHADYSDPDAVRVGDDYWLISSSFSHVPGLPVLHSRDLVNWQLVTHALPRLVPENAFATPQHGKGVWAPSIRHHDGKFWIYYPDPDFGLYLITADDPRGPWSEPTLVKAGRGLIDPCPLWDDDGNVYLIHGWAKSRAGFANVLTLLKLQPDGRSVAEDLGVVVDGNQLRNYTTLEGPKLYKRNGWYYIFAPAGGVKTGWQSVFRSRSIRGPYEPRIVLATGNTPINGPHQGALVDTVAGEWWFLHFQDKGPYGRIVHLQPVAWIDDWPVIGRDPDGDGTGEPVLMHAKPRVAAPASAPTEPPTSDDFKAPTLGQQWQWQANPRAEWFSLSAQPGTLRLFPQPEAQENLFHAPHLLLQKFPALEFTVTTELTLQTGDTRAAAGLIVFGFDYAWIGVRNGHVVQTTVRSANEKPVVTDTRGAAVSGPIRVRVTVREGARCQFSYAGADGAFVPLGEPFQARESRWVGAKFGLFASGSNGGGADFRYFQVEPAQP